MEINSAVLPLGILALNLGKVQFKEMDRFTKKKEVRRLYEKSENILTRMEAFYWQSI